jgi:hypothetical protein
MAEKKEKIYHHRFDITDEVKVIFEDRRSVLYERFHRVDRKRELENKDLFYERFCLKKEKKTFYYLIAQRITSLQVHYTNMDLVITTLVYPDKKNSGLESYRNNPNYKVLRECEITIEIG